jgi:hypothetical protein
MRVDVPRVLALVSHLRNAALLAMVVVAAGCGGSTSKSNSSHPAQPTRNGTFVPGDLDTLPLLPRMRSISPQTRQNGVTTESYRLIGYDPHDAVFSYGELLSGWSVRSSPHAVGKSYRAIWMRGGSNLLVTAIPDPTLKQGDAPELEMTLQLFSPGTTPPTDPGG